MEMVFLKPDSLGQYFALLNSPRYDALCVEIEGNLSVTVSNQISQEVPFLVEINEEHHVTSISGPKYLSAKCSVLKSAFV
jgi:hypothetical protein